MLLPCADSREGQIWLLFVIKRRQDAKNCRLCYDLVLSISKLLVILHERAQ